MKNVSERHTYRDDADGHLQAGPNYPRCRDDVMEKGDLVQADQQDAQAELKQARIA